MTACPQQLQARGWLPQHHQRSCLVAGCFTMRALHATVVAGATYDEVRLFAELLFQGNCGIVGKLLQVWPHIKPGQRTIFERGWVVRP